MRVFAFGWIGALVFAPIACSSSPGSGTGNPDSGGGGTGGGTNGAACTTPDDCNPDRCVCNDDEQFDSATVCLNGSCPASKTDSPFCTSMCEKHGGVKSFGPAPNVADSAECDAWCAKGDGLTCGSKRCNRFFFCSIPKEGCAASERAALKCAVENGSWKCNTSGGWSVTSGCGSFTELCK